MGKSNYIRELTEKVKQVANGNYSIEIELSHEDEELDALASDLNTLIENIRESKFKTTETINYNKKRVNEILKTIIALSNLDFSKKALISKNSDAFDAITSGLNMLGEELLASTVSKSYLDKILNSMADMLIVIDLDKKIKVVNPATVKKLKYSSDGDIIGEYLNSLFTKNDHKKLDVFFKSIQKKGLIQDTEFTLLTKENKEISVLLSGGVMLDYEKKIQGIVYLAQDIGEQTKAKREFTKAKHAADAARRIKNEFIANMSHELRTPMSGIIGMTNLLIESDLVDKQMEFALNIQTSANKLLTILNDLLDFSKIETGTFDIEPISCDLYSLIKETTDTMAILALEKNLEIIIRYPPQIPRRFVGDPGRISQIVNNLLDNAIKFTYEGCIKLDVNIIGEIDDNSLIRISVEDTGIGIPKEKRETIFDEFIQVDSSYTRKYGGTGLGLTITKKLVELMGGEIGMNSEDGKGTNFWVIIRLPIDKNVPQTPIVVNSLKDVPILIVDDNETSLNTLCELTESWKMRTTALTSCKDALGILQNSIKSKDPFLVVLIDNFMSEMNGETFGCKIKSDPLFQDVALVLLVPFGYSYDTKHIESIGFSGCLTKPIHSSDLLKTLEKICEMKRSDSYPSFITRHKIIEQYPSEGLNEKVLFTVDVLLVEDNTIGKVLGRRMLENLGCKVKVASNGKEAIEIANANSFDLIFMDVQMPEIDGIEATLRIRRQENDKKCPPIIAMTAHTMKSEKDKCLNAGMVDFISKPISNEQLQRVLYKWIPKSILAKSYLKK